MDFYLNSHLRKKEFHVMVQPTSQFIVDDVVPVFFYIHSKPKYFQDFMEDEIIKEKITKENFEQVVSHYVKIYNDYETNLNKENLIYIAGNEWNLDTFYVKQDYITVETVIECCKKFAKMKNKNDITVYLNEELLLYKDGEFLNLDRIENNKDNKNMEEYIDDKIGKQVILKDLVILFILEKWIQQEKKKYPKSKKNIEEYFIPSDVEGYFTFDSSEEKALIKKVVEELKLEDFLISSYGKKKGKFIFDVYNENHYERWKW